MIKRKTIGFFIDWVENPYQCSLYSGIKDKAKEKDVNLLAFVGGAIESPRRHEQLRNTIYKVVNKDNIDGLVISSGSVCRFVNEIQFAHYLENFDQIPIVSIGQKLKDVHSILIENKTGLYKMIIHLIRDHGYKNIAFISGPKGNFDAEIRMRIYRETLAEFNIPYNEDIIYPGDFTPQSGIQAVRSLLNQKKQKIDVILAANDDMACGAIEELQRRNISIPKEFAVVGFDDQTSSKIMNPPLSTIRQPIYETGSKALDIICDLIDHKKVPIEIYLETEPIIRESCGCNEESMSQNSVCITPQEVVKINDKEPEILINQLEKLAKTIHNNVLNQTPNQPDFEPQFIKIKDIDEILHALFSSFHKNDHTPFLSALKIQLYKTISFSRNKEIMWQIFISVLRSYILPFLSLPKRELAENILHKARLLIDDYSEREYLLKALKEEQAYQIFRDIGEHIISLESMEDVLDVLGMNFPQLGILSCYLSLYEGKDKESSHYSNSKLLFAISPKGRVKIGREGISFPTRRLFPSGIIPNESAYSLIVESIFFGKNELGIILFEPGAQKSFTSEIMRRLLLNSALKGAAFIQQIQNQAYNLKKTNKELQNTLYTLQATQKSLVETKKMAALGGLVAGIAHEINTPLGIGVTAASHLAKETQELLIKIEINDLKKSELLQYLTTANEATSMILANLQRSHELIKSFKGIAVDQSSEEKREFNLKSYIQDILLSLRPKLKKVNHTIIIDCPEDIILASYPGAFSQIITNLILNSLIHAFDDNERGIIEINIKSNNDELIFTYLDNGKGIEQENLNKVFDPFFTTKRSQGGTGLGLHLIFNIITQTLRGTIKCTSSPGMGTQFLIQIPIKIEDQYIDTHSSEAL